MNEQQAISAEKEKLVVKYLAASADSSSGAAKELQNIIQALNGIYWKTVENTLAQKINPNNATLNLSDHDFLLIDFGLLDMRLVKNITPNLPGELLAERNMVGLPNHFYLSEWLGDRLKKYEVESEIAITQSERDETTLISSAYSDLESYFIKQNAGLGVKLPGISDSALNAFISGRLDQQIIVSSVGLLGKRQRADLAKRNRLVRLRRDITIAAKSALPEEAVPFFDAIDDAYRALWRGEISGQGALTKMAAEEERTPESEKTLMVNWLLDELRFAKAIIPLGAMAGGVIKSSSVLLENRPRVTREHTKAILERMPWCDRNCQSLPVVLIAPFTGRGVYEWDRDSLVSSLLPVETPADAVANAVANYSMMLDSLQHHARLRQIYCAAFPKENFQQSFQRDYRQWLGQVGMGKESGLSAQKFNFFMEHIALNFMENPALALAPRELRTLSPAMRELLRKQIENKTEKNSWLMRYRLGILLWIDQRYPEALTEMANAANLAPRELHTSFAVALLLIESGQKEKAKPVLASLNERGAATIWKFYAARVLERIA